MHRLTVWMRARRANQKLRLGAVLTMALTLPSEWPALAQIYSTSPPGTSLPRPSIMPETGPGSADQSASPFGATPDEFPGLAPPTPPSIPEAEPSGLPSTETPGVSPTPTETEAPPTAPQIAPSPTEPALSAAPPSPFGVLPGTLPGVPPASVAAPPLLTTPNGFSNGFGPIGGAAGTPSSPTAPPVPAVGIGLRPLKPGAVPVQTGDIRAPPILIVPTVNLSEGYTDNPRNKPATFSDSVTHLIAGSAISVDSARFQGQFNGTLDFLKYARASDEDTLNINALGFGLGTIVADHLFIDGRVAATQVSTTGGLGFAPTAIIPPSQQTQTEIISLTPIARTSVGPYIDGELRYNFGLNLFQNGGDLTGTSGSSSSSALSNALVNEATLTLATSSRFTAFGSRLTLDASETDSQSAAKNNQLHGYDDLEYQFNRTVAGLARIGYETLRYPLQPQATTTGPIWLLGGRLTPWPGSYLVVHYGREYGFYGFDGILRYPVTPATTALVSVQRNLSSSQQQLLTNLNNSEADIYGNLVNQQTGLPTALSNPEFAYANNNIFRQEQARAGVQTALAPNTFSIFGFLDKQSALSNTISSLPSGSDTAFGANFNWTRTITERLVSDTSFGYAIEDASHEKTLTMQMVLTYYMNRRLNAFVHYLLINVNSPLASSSYTRNQIEVGLKRSF